MSDEPRTNAGVLAALLEEDVTDLYENAPCGYLSTDADGVILKMNATFAALTGWTRDEIVGRRRFLDLLTVGGRIFYETHLRPLLRMQGFVREIALDLHRADGRQLPVLVNAVERRSAGANGSVIRLTLFDATDRRRYERELLAERHKAEDAARARSDLIAMVSHDVRAPLSALLTAATMLGKTSLSAQQERYVRMVLSSATHALTLLNSILDLSALDAGHATLREKPFDPRALVEQAVASARIAASTKQGLEVRSEIDEHIPERLLGDPDKIAQVLMNLVGNAVKFTERGFVSVLLYARELRPDAVTLEFLVSDTGIGIPADRLQHVFEEFTQATKEIGEKYGGTGLGLAISRKVLRVYGSDLHVTSTEGQGTTFSFQLALKKAPQAP